MEKDALKSFGHGLRLGKYNRLNIELSDVVRYISVFFSTSESILQNTPEKKILQETLCLPSCFWEKPEVVSLDGPLNHLFFETLRLVNPTDYPIEVRKSKRGSQRQFFWAQICFDKNRWKGQFILFILYWYIVLLIYVLYIFIEFYLATHMYIIFIWKCYGVYWRY